MEITAQVLKLTIHNELVGYLCGYDIGENVLIFDQDFVNNSNRPSLGILTLDNHPYSKKTIQKLHSSYLFLHPILSNLLPEGALRGLIIKNLKTHYQDDFKLLTCLGQDLPGALIAQPLTPDEAPIHLKHSMKNVQIKAADKYNLLEKFSLAGVQLKFSMKAKPDGRYVVSNDNALGDWIIKPPSVFYKDVPLNEFSIMTLAQLAGVDIPQIRLVKLNLLDNLPSIKFPEEPLCYAIKRFDREGDNRIHIEDFAQALNMQPHHKYNLANYEQMGKILKNFSGRPIEDIQQFAIRLLVNILLGNGDAHLKNTSLIFHDKITPQLSPAYDIVSTFVYLNNETTFALNLGKNKNLYHAQFEHFKKWSDKIGIHYSEIETVLKLTLEKARDLWPNALTTLPMNEEHKAQLIRHWHSLHKDFKIV